MASQEIEIPKPGELISREFDKFFRTHETQRWVMGDIDFSLAPYDKVSPLQIKAIRGALAVESHNPVYTQVLLEMNRPDHEMTSFIVTWAYEENKHYMVLRQYLLDSGKMDRDELKAELGVIRSGPWGDEERNFSRIKSFTYTTLQEQVTGFFYQKFAEGLDDAPLLKLILHLIGKDEYRHCQYYLMKAKQELAQDKGRMREVDEALLTFGMPGPTFIKNYSEYGVAMTEAIGGKGDSLKQIVLKVKDLTGLQHIVELAMDRSYRRQLEEQYGFDLGEIARDILKPRLPSFSLPSIH